MKHGNRIILEEALWIGSCVVVSLILVLQLTRASVTDTIDINVHDTYFIVDFLSVYLYAFTSITYGVYLVRQAYLRFRRNTANIVLVLSSVMPAHLLFLYYGFLEDGIDKSRGWIIHPHLSTTENPATHAETEFQIIGFVILTAIIIICSSVFAAIFFSVRNGLRTRKRETAE